MRGWDTHNNGNFDLQLMDIITKQSICAIKIGTVVKQGRALKLSEAHGSYVRKTTGFPKLTIPEQTFCGPFVYSVNYNSSLTI